MEGDGDPGIFSRKNQGRRPKPPTKQERDGSNSLHQQDQTTAKEQQPQRPLCSHHGGVAPTRSSRKKVSRAGITPTDGSATWETQSQTPAAPLPPQSRCRPR